MFFISLSFSGVLVLVKGTVSSGLAIVSTDILIRSYIILLVRSKLRC